MGAKMFGASVKRKEDPAFLTGKGRFVDDIVLPNMAYAAFVRSPFPHARIRGIDASAARNLPGVVGVLTFADLPESLRERRLPLFVPSPALTQPRMPHALAKDEVCYVGEPVAIVVAESRYLAEDALGLVEVDYEALPAISDCKAALAPGAPEVHLANGTNVAARMPSVIGDVEAAFREAPHVFREEIFQHRGGPFFMECRGAIAQYDPILNSLLFYVSSQGSHRIKRGLLEVFDLGDHQVRVVTPDVGGGFGPKGSIYVEYPTLCAAAMALGRPVKWIEDRLENFVATHQERDQYWDVEIAVDEDARILGVRGTLTHDNGAYTPWGIVLPWISATTVPGPYVIPAFRIDLISVLTNKVPATPVRGAGRPQAVVVMERLMDRVARELGLDPAEVRRRNFIQPSQMPYKVGIIFRDGRPVTYDSGDYPACQAAALDAIGYDGFRARQAEARRQGRYIGIGIGNAVEGTGLGPYEGATVRVATNGRLVVYTGATPQGQSHKTTLAQIAADQFGVPIDAISIETADTGAISLGIGSFAARTAVNAGSSVHIAATKVAEKIKLIASEMLEASPEDLELKDGYVHIAGVPDMRKSFKEVATKAIGMPGFSMAGGLEPGLEHTAYFTPDQSTYANGTTVTEVEVEIETGRVKILRLVIAHDCGRVINPMIVDGQIVGGVAHGIGNALYERLVHDDEGQLLSANFGEYLLPLAPDVPRVEIIHQETPSPLNPLGMKGAGEGGTIPTTASVIAAIEDALSPFGVRIAEAPISPQRIVQLLGDAALGRAR
jgi:carbon-monoxide dehydrogenase large subunit